VVWHGGGGGGDEISLGAVEGGKKAPLGPDLGVDDTTLGGHPGLSSIPGGWVLGGRGTWTARARASSKMLGRPKNLPDFTDSYRGGWKVGRFGAKISRFHGKKGCCERGPGQTKIHVRASGGGDSGGRESNPGGQERGGAGDTPAAFYATTKKFRIMKGSSLRQKRGGPTGGVSVGGERRLAGGH